MSRRYVLICLMLLCALRCSAPLDGGGETTNGYVTGIAVFENGSPAPGAVVTLIEPSYDPQRDGKIPAMRIDTTGQDGSYRIRATGAVRWNIEAAHTATGTRLFVKECAVSDDTLPKSYDTLKRPGALQVILDGNQRGYLYVPGTTVYKNTTNSGDSILLDSIPAGMTPGLVMVPEIGTRQVLAERVFVSSNRTTLLESGTTRTRFAAPDGPGPGDSVGMCAIDQSGTLWVGTSGNGLFSFDGASTWQRFDFPGHNILCDDIDRNGIHWIGSDSGLYAFDGTGFTRSLVIAGDTIRDQVHAIFVDAADTKWIVTPLAIYKGDGAVWESCDYGMTGYSDLLVDAAGTVWIGTLAGGLIADNGVTRQTYTPVNSPLPSGIVHFLCRDSTGAIVVGTAAGLAKINNGAWSVSTRTDGTLPYYALTKGVIDPLGGLWLCGDATNVYAMDNARTYSSNFLWGNYARVETIQVDRYGVLWAGSSGGGLVRVEMTVD